MTIASVPALLVSHVPVGGPQGSPTGGGHNMLISALLYVGVLAAGAAVAPLLLGRRASFTRERLVLAVVLLTGVVVVATRGAEPADVALTAAHLVVVTVWVGAVVHLAGPASVRRPDELRRAIARFAPTAVSSAALTAVTGTILVLREPVSVRALLGSTFGALLALKVLSLLVAAALGVGHRRARSAAERSTFLRAESGILAAALALGAALVATAAPAAAVTTAAPGVSIVTLRSPISFFLDDDRGVGRLTLLTDESVAVVDRPSGHVIQLQPGATTAVTLTRSSASVTIVTGQQQRTVRLHATAVVVPPSPLLADPEARVAWALGRILGTRQAAAAPAGVCLPDGRSLSRAQRALLANRVDAHDIISGTRTDGLRRLSVVATGKTMPSALYLAPSLLDRVVLTAVASLRLPPVTVVGVGDPMSPVADRYRAALALAGGGAPPTTAGLLGYESVVSPLTERRVALFAAAPIGFLPGVVDEGHPHADDPWIPGGTVVATTRTLTVRLDCTTEEVS